MDDLSDNGDSDYDFEKPKVTKKSRSRRQPEGLKALIKSEDAPKTQPCRFSDDEKSLYVRLVHKYGY